MGRGGVWFRVAEAHAALVDAATANAFVAGLFLAAMATGEDVQASGPICPALGGHSVTHVPDTKCYRCEWTYVGYDCPLSDRPLRAEIERRVHDVSVRTGRTAVIVEPNLREFAEPLVSWPSNHGAALRSSP